MLIEMTARKGEIWIANQFVCLGVIGIIGLVKSFPTLFAIDRPKVMEFYSSKCGARGKY